MGQQTTKELPETDIEIFFWYGQRGAVGHVSLFIVKTGLYISFWPEGCAKLFTKNRSQGNSYKEDKISMGREPDHVHKVRIGLDTSAVEKFWKDAKKRGYQFLGSNCSDAVEEALLAGNNEFFRYPIDFGYGDDIYIPPRGPYRRQIEKIRDELAVFRDRAIGSAIFKT